MRLFFLFLIFLASCQSPTEIVEEPKVHHYIITNSALGSPWDKNALITFNQSGYFTLLSERNFYLEGDAKFTDSSYTITVSNSTYSFKIIKNENDIHLFHKDIDLAPNYKLHYEHVDLLSRGRNWWRVKPEQKETNKAIEHRVVSHLNYVIDYFQMLEDSKSRTFSVQYLNLPFRLYGNGISLPQFSKLSDEWKDIFYDEESAMYAYQVLQKAIKSIQKYPKDKKSHIKGFIRALDMMIIQIES